ncbi:transporter [Thiobacillus sedimenti]|uniref:Transporter n=1 Tax=Thiobacillus sedimenti TaxID=3110231 RepID=A0ABZ1CML9_9PROT|nr:transporter [Thiobacillus sp. SCUT-2]WRS39567.1 transporter [Thiobacillus sp. SCUT-2]
MGNFKKGMQGVHMGRFPTRLGVSLAQAGLITALACAAPVARADEPPSPAPGDLAAIKQELAKQARALAEQQRELAIEQKKLDAHRQALDDSRRRLAALQKQLGMAPDEPRAGDDDLLVSGGQGGGSVPENPPVDVGTLFAQPTILTPKGAVVFEPSLQYSFSNSDRVSIVGYSILPALVIGLIDVRTVSRSTWIAAADVRYGLTNRLELEAKVPYVYRYDDTFSRPLDLSGGATEQMFNASGNGIGDIELAARYQLNLPKGNDPFYIAGLRLKTRTGKDPFEVSYAPGSTLITAGSLQTELPTGSGFYTLQPSLSMVMPADPAVFYGGISYLWNIKRDINKNVGGVQIGQVDPGDGVDFNVGMGLALNERSSFSVGYEHTWIGKSTLNGVTPPTELTTQLASLLVGYSYRLNQTTSLNLSIGAGLTNDTPDTQITLRVPMRF